MPDSNHDYAWSRIEHALDEADGNPAQAQRLLVSWAEVDDELLRGLAEPHLKSLIGYALQQTIFDDAEDDTPSTTEKDIKETRMVQQAGVEGEQLEIGEFGMALLQNMTGGSRPQNFGFATDEMDAPQKTSKKHIDSIMKIAKKKEIE